MKGSAAGLVIAWLFVTSCAAQEVSTAATPKVLIVDGFEEETVSVSADTTEKHAGARSLRIAVESDQGVLFWKAFPEAIPWESYGAISFWMKGTGSGAEIAFVIMDARGETHRYAFKDDSSEWRQVLCPFGVFVSDGDGAIDLPFKTFRFEPLAMAEGVLYIDDVALEPLN